ncbi:hypothetical protein [Nitrospira defluvii]|uniref:Uncharacterized protein n=1 Tax=Nitrospira defluvii TaxID=330214 RepID=A0ABM8QDE3_9BACT|nr:hypothetical protein [Nitrospira defluvii]CAE6691309.1 hypothetical protein NSPZN2_10235 [Nitrospira defluvii]
MKILKSQRFLSGILQAGHKTKTAMLVLGLFFLVAACIPSPVRGQVDLPKSSSRGDGGSGESFTLHLNPDLTKHLIAVTERVENEKWYSSPSFITIFVSIAGIIVTIVIAKNTVKSGLATQRKILIDQERLKRVNAQLNEFYAPLHALDSTGVRLWKKFCETYKRNCDQDKFLTHDEDGIESGPPEEFLECYMRAMRETFGPLNQQRENLVLTKAALVAKDQNGDFPEVLIKLVAHVSEMRSVMGRWQDTEKYKNGKLRSILQKEGSAAFYPQFKFPADLAEFAKEGFDRLRAMQGTLEDTLSSPEQVAEGATRR